MSYQIKRWSLVIRCSDRLQVVYSQPIVTDWEESELLLFIKEQQIVLPVL